MVDKILVFILVLLAVGSAISIPGHIKRKRYLFVGTGIIGIIASLTSLFLFLFGKM